MIIQPHRQTFAQPTMSQPSSALLERDLQGISPLPSLGVLQAKGEEAAHFLHNQLTNDVLLLPVGQARLTAFCNAKGRMQASMVLLKMAPDTLLLVMPLDLLPQTLRRLSMFVLRAKVRLSDASTQWQLRGLLGDLARTAVADAAPWQTTAWAGGHAVALYPAVAGDARQARALWVGASDSPAPQGQSVPPDVWAWGSVLSGVPFVTQPVFEAFVPQMLNYESVGGVNFKKGCYPGQEVVARSQFRGTLKRRMARVSSPVPLQTGQDVFTKADPEQPCATVVQCAARPDGSGFDALVSGTLESMGAGWHAGSVHGEPLELLPLPYPLRDDI